MIEDLTYRLSDGQIVVLTITAVIAYLTALAAVAFLLGVIADWWHNRRLPKASGA